MKLAFAWFFICLLSSGGQSFRAGRRYFLGGVAILAIPAAYASECSTLATYAVPSFTISPPMSLDVEQDTWEYPYAWETAPSESQGPLAVSISAEFAPCATNYASSSGCLGWCLCRVDPAASQFCSSVNDPGVVGCSGLGCGVSNQNSYSSQRAWDVAPGSTYTLVFEVTAQSGVPYEFCFVASYQAQVTVCPCDYGTFFDGNRATGWVGAEVVMGCVGAEGAG